MARYCFVFVAFEVIFSTEPGYCGWEELIIVNDTLTNKQASRGDDCPWSIAADDNGNVYAVWEDQRNEDLQIYFRKRDYNGNWDQSDELISVEPNWNPNGFGHPSICVLPGDYPPVLLACYVSEDGYSSNLKELRGNTFDGDYWGEEGYLISDSSGYQLGSSSAGWSTNLVALSDGKAYAFWQYDVGVDLHLYFNEYDDGWIDSAETKVYTGDSSSTHNSRFENACVDGDDTIHLVYADQSGSNAYKIYYLNKSTNDNDFGAYPGTQVSGAPADTAAMHPYCAISVVNDTSFLHVVWSTKPQSRVFYRKLNLESDTWSSIVDTIASTSEFSYKPSVACDSYGNIHVAWEKGGYATDPPHNYDYQVVKYRKFDILTGEWDRIATLPADEEEIEKYGLPVIISDVYDNLHVLSIGELNSRIVDEEVFYSFFDAPPHIEDLEFLADESDEDSVVISWTGSNEPDLHTYRVYRKLGAQWEFVDSTTATRYADTEVSYSSPCFQQVPTYYYVEAVDDADQSAFTDTLEIFCIEGPGKIYAGKIADLINLQNNYPNPFNAQTTIEYTVPFEMEITLEVYDILGRKVEMLIDAFQSPDSYAVTCDASHIASVMYFYSFKAGEYSDTKRLTIIK